MSQITLTDDQEAAFKALVGFLIHPTDTVFVIEGYSGTGKTTLVQHVMDNLDRVYKLRQTLMPNKRHPDYEILLTATTNKAAAHFAQATKRDVATIQSTLGLRLERDIRTGRSQLVPTKPNGHLRDKLIFIDEGSYADDRLKKHVMKMTQDCKIVWMGDPAQLLGVGAETAPIFNSGYKTAKLTEVVRQKAGSPIQDLSVLFRETVNTGEWFNFDPDGDIIRHVPRETFDQAIIDEMTRPDWTDGDSKVLAWTNRKVQAYNKGLQDLMTGARVFREGDMAVNNQHVDRRNGNGSLPSIRTDALVSVQQNLGEQAIHGVVGVKYQLESYGKVFVPHDLKAWESRLTLARAEGELDVLTDINNSWADLRANYASTINKAQGSTYDQVFIDLDDIKRCQSGEQIARMLYVGVSRARHRVTLTGDLA